MRTLPSFGMPSGICDYYRRGHDPSALYYVEPRSDTVTFDNILLARPNHMTPAELQGTHIIFGTLSVHMAILKTKS